MAREPVLELRNGRTGSAVKQQITWSAPPVEVSPDSTAVLYLDKEVVEVTSDKPAVVTVLRRRQGAADRYAIDVKVKG